MMSMGQKAAAGNNTSRRSSMMGRFLSLLSSSSMMLVLVLLRSSVDAFTTSTIAYTATPITATSSRCHGRQTGRLLKMVGGKGWENNGYLDSLGGDDDDREQASQQYQEFHDTRQAFLKRQEERLNTPEGQRFMEQQQRRVEESWQQQPQGMEAMDDFGMGGEFDELGVSSGGSRFRNMMQKSQQMQQQRRGLGGGIGGSPFIDPATGLEQRFVAPLNDDDDDDDNNISNNNPLGEE